jgi:hypothetical protein
LNKTQLKIIKIIFFNWVEPGLVLWTGPGPAGIVDNETLHCTKTQQEEA